MIRLSKLDKYYNKGRQNQVHAVNNISLELPDRGMIAFFGKSGCGKTTLLNIIGGLDSASSGDVSVDGRSITPNSDNERNLKVGYIFQNYNLSERMNVFDNVAASLRLCGIDDENEISGRVLAALESVDMVKFRNRMPSALSGGQQQRVAISRAIVKNPSLILADEPTGNLDEQNTVMVMDLLKAISKEKLVLIVTHEAHLVDSYCDKVIGISDGKIFEERQNTVTDGYDSKKTNEVYLGDMNREIISDGELCLEYYGENESKPSNIRIISAGGVLYISADEGVRLKLADSSSELVVHEGKYVEKKKKELKPLPDILRDSIVPRGKIGHMFGFVDAIKSGYKVNFAKKRKRKKLLITGMICFSAIIVFFMAGFGAALNEYMKIDRYYNSHTVAVSAEKMSEEEARQLVSDGDAELYTITSRYTLGSPSVQESMTFSFGNFETASNFYNAGISNSSIHPLPSRMLSGREVIEGVGKISEERDIIITRALADRLIESANISTVSSYRDLLNSTATEGNNSGYYGYDIDIAPAYGSSEIRYTVVGIVEGNDEEVFFDEYSYLQKNVSRLYGLPRNYISDFEHSKLLMPELDEGEVYVGELVETTKSNLVLGGKTFSVAGRIDSNVTDEMLKKYSIEMHGVDLTDSLTAYLNWSRGYESFEAWLSDNYGEDAESDEAQAAYKVFRAEVTREYKSFVNNMALECKAQLSELSASIVMNRKDMEDIAITYSKGDMVGISANIYKGGKYVFYSYEIDALCNSLENKYGASEVITPDDAKEYLRMLKDDAVTGMAISLIVVILILSACVYFIMRSALLGDIKEVGISRAIGVSRRNLCYRYFIESLVLFVLTVFVGYLLAGGLMGLVSSAELGIAYYPWWIALASLVLVFAITVICGQIPIRSLLRKTPAEILAKYDI